MQVHPALFFGLIEALLLAALYAAYLLWRLRRLRATAAGSQAMSPPGPYVERLQREVLETEAALARLGEPTSTADADARQRQLLETRLVFLRAERKAADGPPEQFQARLEEGLAPFLGGDGESLLVQSLRSQVQACEKRLSNLERFKDLFFELKGRLADSQERGEQLQMEVSRVVPESEQSPLLKNLLDGLKTENEQLNQQLDQVDEALAAILRQAERHVEANGDGVNASITGIDAGVERIRNVVQAQQRRIAELAELVSARDMELEQKAPLESLLEEVRASNEELNTVVSVLQEENDFLQVQISMLLKQELEKEKERERVLAETAKSQADLKQRFAAMEKEYLLVYEENRRLKGDAGPG